MRIRLLILLIAFLSMPVAASVTGVIINSDGQPIAGAKVSLYAPETIESRRLRLVSTTPERTALATVTTDSKGTFSFDSPKGQSVVDVTVQASGYAPDLVRLLADDDAGAIALVAAPMQRGTITASGKPVADAAVVWFGNNTDFLVKTDAEGHYSVPDPTKWANRLIVVHPDYAMVDDVAQGPRMTPKLDRSLSAGSTITGRVLAEDGKSGVAKASLFVDDFPVGVTADDGSFKIAHAPANWQDVQARSGNLAGVRARNGNAASNIRLAKSAKVTGVVRDAKTQLPIANAEVRLGPEMMAFGRRMRGFFGGGNGPVIESVLTDAKGNFSITTEPGRYTLWAIYPGSAIANAPLSLTAGQSVNKPLFGAAQGRVSGFVVDEDRRPVPGARLVADAVRRGGGGPMAAFIPPPRAQEFEAYSGPDGRFVIRRVLTDTDVQVTALKKGFQAAQSASLKLNAGEKKSGISITIPRGVAFSGRVVDSSGRPASGVSVAPVEAQGGPRGAFVRRAVNMMARERDDDVVRTGTDGTFTVRVKQGTYDVIFKREGLATKVLHGTAIDAATKPVEVKLDPSVEISGRVVRNGGGIEGVTVNAMGEEGVASAITSSDGSFTITDVTPGQMMLNVMKADAFIQQIRSITAPASNLLIELPAGGRITGRVVDKSSHNPVASFQAGIAFQRGAGGMMIALPPMLKDFTSDDGTFTLENVPPGSTQLVVSAPGYTTARIPGLNVEDGKSLDNVDVSLDTGVRLMGRVIGPDGAPLSGVSIRENTSPGVRTIGPGGGVNATTDPNGEYTIEAIDPGEKTFTFTHSGYLSVDKSITLSGHDARLDAQLSSGMTVNGVVVTDAGAPVADAGVSAVSASTSMFGSPNARTDANGNFQIVGLAPGHYRFMARKEGVGSGQLDFDVASGGSPRVVIPAGGTIVGHVTGLTEAELQNAVVNASSATGNASAAVDASGAYRIDGAPTGTVHVTARTNSGFGPGGKSSGVVAVQVDAGSTATADIQFKSNTVVTGRVTRNGQPMANVMVGFNPRGGPAASSSGNTDSNGNYTISGLDDGNYNVSVVDIDRSNAFTSTYEVHGSGTFDIDIKTASLRGTVVDASTGEPIAAAAVQLQNSQGGFMAAHMVQTDPSGAFFVDNVARGSYHIVVQKDGYGNVTRDITVADTAPDDLQFKLATSAGVTINVVDARDNTPLAANVVRIVDSAGQSVTAGGGFGFSSSPQPIKLTLAPGTYTVTLTAMGYAGKIVTVTSPSQITVALTQGGRLIVRSNANAQTRGRLVDANGTTYRNFNIDPSPLTTTIPNVAAGNYTLQLLDKAGAVINSQPVTVVDGQDAAVSF
jgi:uncharacterized GH25 family protein